MLHLILLVLMCSQVQMEEAGEVKLKINQLQDVLAVQ